ncbi:hypothetical protein [Tomitella biformata]|uniref:hypothetical protein n=1 Tax=Tomitella biformata TaxID=630403 RepID=UPI000465CC67|nr:hypothetical protein [Tomitella biformata]
MSVSTVPVLIDGSSSLPHFRVGDEVAWQLFWSARVCGWHEFMAPAWRPVVEQRGALGVSGNLSVEIYTGQDSMPDGASLELSGPLLLTDRRSGPATTGTVTRIRLITCMIGDPGTVTDGWIVPVPLPETAVFEELEESVDELVVEELDHAVWSYRVQLLLVELLVDSAPSP